MMGMPGKSYRGPLIPLQQEEKRLRTELQQHVLTLGGTIGERNLIHYERLKEAALYVRASFEKHGYEVGSQSYQIGKFTCENLEAEVPGLNKPEEIILVGAHYDSVEGSPGANDNGTGVAALLALSRMFAGRPLERTLRFVAFVNEEPPYFQTSAMGSRVYAVRSQERQGQIVLMISLETMGYYTEKAGSQHYPFPLRFFYPSQGNFIGFVSNFENKSWVQRVVESFRRHGNVASEGAALWSGLPGIGWSDHWSFWQEGIPAIMVTDTALFRDPHYHTSSDLPEYVNYDFLTHIVAGLSRTLADLGNGQ